MDTSVVISLGFSSRLVPSLVSRFSFLDLGFSFLLSLVFRNSEDLDDIPHC